LRRDRSERRVARVEDETKASVPSSGPESVATGSVDRGFESDKRVSGYVSWIQWIWILGNLWVFEIDFLDVCMVA